MLAATGAARLYVADLDALLGTGANLAVVAGLVQSLPGVEVWLDNGCRPGEVGPAGVRTVYGTESLDETLHGAGLELGSNAVLSLDYRGQRPLGPGLHLLGGTAWPRDIIIMDLACVGREQGFNASRLREHRGRYPGHCWFVGGGIRSARDLATATEAGASGALVATALHRGHLRAGDVPADR